MIIPVFEKEKEFTIIGTYPGCKGMDGAIVPESPRYARPVSPRDNFRDFFQGRKPAYMPYIGFFNCDVVEFRPRQHPDNLANHQCIDGGPYVDFETIPKINLGWFNIPLEWEPVAHGASVRPGNPILPDISEWREKLVIPDLDEINWEEMKKMNHEFLGTDKANQLGIQFGFWERMMNLMDVDNAAIALVDEDVEDDIHEFLDMLSDLYIEYIKRIQKIGRIDSVQIHDDWGTARGPFFSLDICRRFFVPPMKKLVSFCHDNDMVFEQHCCGNAGQLIPAMLECGIDCWFPQTEANDVDRYIQEYQDKPIIFARGSAFLHKGISEKETRELAKKWVEKYKDRNVVFREDAVVLRNPAFEKSMYQVFVDAVYEYSRIAYASR